MDSPKRMLDSISSNKSKNKKKQSKTIRLTVDLKNTDENGCAVFNYRDLVRAEMDKRKRQKAKEQNGNTDNEDDDIRNEDEEALKKIALQYEEKYGSSNNMRYQTYTELGAGYDENDSFIDNTEACEELLPEELEPIRGGFYVNSGKLEFKTLHGHHETKKGKKLKVTEVKFDLKEKSQDSENKISNGKLFRRNSQKQFLKGIPVEVVEIQDNSAKIELEPEQNAITEPNNEVIAEEKKDVLGVQQFDNDKTENDSADTNVISNSDTSNSADKDKEGSPIFPANVSPEICSYVNELKSQASNISLQRKFFSDSANITLLNSLETKCRMELNNVSRQNIYKYLTHFLPYTKATLMSRAKKIFCGIEQLESLINRIQSIIKRYDTFDNHHSQGQILEESNEYLVKAVQIKIREYIVSRSAKKVSLESHLAEFFSGLVTLWPEGVMSINRLQTFLNDTIKTEAEAFKLNYSLSNNATDLSVHNTFNTSVKSPETNCDQNQELTSIVPSSSTYSTSEYPLSLTKDVTSADDKVQMQLDQVLQDLVVLSQMSSDTSPTSKF